MNQERGPISVYIEFARHIESGSIDSALEGRMIFHGGTETITESAVATLKCRKVFREGELTVTEPVEAYIDGEINGVLMRPLSVFNDARGWLVELFRQDELVQEWWPMMTYVSQTLPGVTRGPHEHVNQTDGFAMIGPSDFKLFLWDIRVDSVTRGRRMVTILGASNPAAVWIPPGVVHAYRNIGDMPGLVFNAPNRLYAGWGKKEPVDEIRHEEAKPAKFPMD